MRMHGKAIIVTGGAGGIGREIVRRMASEGGRVLIADINIEGAERVAREIGGEASAVHFDAYDPATIETMVQTAADRFGAIDVLVNNAADTSLISLDRTILDTDLATFDKSIASNLRAVFIATKAALPHLLKSQGAIVNISSNAALVGDTWLIAYSAAKAGVLSLTRNTAIQYGKQGVRCNSICPGFIAHGPARKLMPETLPSALSAAFVMRNGEPSDIAALTAFLASDEAAFINGANVTCDGGHSVALSPWRASSVTVDHD